MSSPDFKRNLFCLLGVPFDNIGMDDALSMVRQAVERRRKCLISTPNINIVVRSAFDRDFRSSLVRSDLSLVDGMPLVWAGRRFGIDVKGRVTGAGLFERMRRKDGTADRISVYLFGGSAGVARIASETLNREDGGVRCVGHHSPGYGSVEEMSDPEIIREINASGADFLLVALGAKKGQGWIEHNWAALEVPVVSHLGAAINFTAGNLRRAPVGVQNAGLEWAWRIYQEPGLWRRYVLDGAVVLGLLAKASLNLGLAALLAAGRPTGETLRVEVAEGGGEVAIGCRGNLTEAGLAPLRTALEAHACTGARLRLDLGGVRSIDSSAIALLMILRRHRLDLGHAWHCRGASVRVARTMKAYGAGEIVGRSGASPRVPSSRAAGRRLAARLDAS